jgi:hypothetical protein
VSCFAVGTAIGIPDSGTKIVMPQTQPGAYCAAALGIGGLLRAAIAVPALRVARPVLRHQWAVVLLVSVWLTAPRSGRCGECSSFRAGTQSPFPTQDSWC